MNSVNVELVDNFERQQDVVERAGLSVSLRDFWLLIRKPYSVCKEGIDSRIQGCLTGSKDRGDSQVEEGLHLGSRSPGS